MKLALATLSFALSVAAPAFAQNILYVNTSPTEASCTPTQSTFAGYFLASSFALGGTVTAPGAKIALGNLILSKSFDPCSGILMTQFLTEAQIPTVTLLEATSTAAGPSVTLKIVLTGVAILNYTLTDVPSGGGAAGLAAMENITFSYQTACIYTAPIPGGHSQPTKTCYNTSTGMVN